MKKTLILSMVLWAAIMPYLLQSAEAPEPRNAALPAAVEATDSITVYIFLLETCPICQSITIEMKNVYAKYHTKGITFVGVFSSPDLSDKNTIEKFRKKYNLPFELKSDENRMLMKQFSATVTPQVFVVRHADSTVLYKGRIDNSFEALGKRRQVITEHYLDKTLENILNNQPINPTETQPVGCFISQ